jgi:hypothetical protein
MRNQESLKKVIGLVNSGKSYPALQLVQANPQTAALVSKLIKPRERNDFDLKRENSHHALNQAQILAISESTADRASDNENILKLFPDIELAVQILVSSILSPKDMVKSELIYKAKEPILPSELLLKLNQVVSGHFENHYEIKEELQEILRDTLFNTGSYIKAVLPESVVDEIINQNRAVSTESMSELFKPQTTTVEHLGFLGNTGAKRAGTALENFLSSPSPISYNAKVSRTYDGTTFALEHLEIVDNYKLLKLPAILEVANQQKVKSLVRKDINKSRTVSLEAQAKEKKLSPQELATVMYKSGQNNSQTFMAIPGKGNSKRKDVGRPLVLRLPSESVIPVYVPGNESKHIGYFILVDTDGNPVSRKSKQDNNDGLSSLLSSQNQSQSLSSMLTAKAKKNLIGNDSVPTLDQITKVYGSIVEADMMERLSNGLYGNNVKISENQEIYRIMLTRALASKYTRLIYIPAELTTYFAFKYFDNGVGKSYLDDIKNLTSLRAILLFSKVMAMTKSAINITHVNMTLDPQDPDPQKTIEMSQHEIIKMRQQYFPLGINSPVDLVDWIQRAGLEFSFEGHPGLPQTKFDFESKNIQHQVPDSDLDELLRKQTYMAFGLSPETVDNGFNSEFATTVVSNNILLSKRIIQLQQTFTKHLSDYLHKVTSNDTIILDEIKQLLKENQGLVEKSLSDEEKADFKENEDKFYMDLIDRYIENLEVDLPRPDITSLQTQSTAFTEYSDALEKVLDSWISSEFITSDLAGEISSNIDSIKAVVKGYYIRRWMSENGYMPELNDIVTSNEDGKPTLDIYELNHNHIEGLIRSSMKFIQKMSPVKQAADKDLQNLGTEPGTPDSTSDTPSDDGGTGGDDGLGGMDDLNDLGLDTPAPAEQPIEGGADKPAADETADSVA